MDKQQKIDHLFQVAREQQTSTSFEETKNRFLNSLENSSTSTSAKKGKIFNLKNSIIMSTSIAFISLIAGYFWFSSETAPQKPKTATDKILSNSKIENAPKKETAQQTKSEIHLKGKSLTAQEQSSENEFISAEVFEKSIENYNFEAEIKRATSRFVPQAVDEYQFPKLTEEEIKKTLKQKKKMLKALAKMDNDYYSYIPSGTFDYCGTKTSVQGFIMQKTEVSNLEYRTYLFDLLIQGRKEEFLKAKPDQQAWKIALENSAQFMIDNYFSNEAYNDFPVNNISRDGAELYCKWLTNELVNYLGEDKTKRIMDIRIPTRQEWVKAASVEGKYPRYGFEDSLLYNTKYGSGAFTLNFNLKNYHGPLQKRIKDSLKYFVYYPAARYPFLTSLETTWRKSFYENSYGLTDMCGNVAEMVVDGARMLPNMDDTLPKQKPILTPGTAGGGWMNSAEEIKIFAPDNHPNETKPHPNIGFRIVTSYLGRGATIYK